MEEKKAQYRTYTEEFKLEALALVKSSGKKCGQIERDLGITPGLLMKWRNKYDCLGITVIQPYMVVAGRANKR